MISLSLWNLWYGKASAYNAGDLGSIPGSGRSSGEGNGNPIQYSCLENPMDRGTWWAAVHGVAKSCTWLSDFTFTFHILIVLSWGFNKAPLVSRLFVSSYLATILYKLDYTYRLVMSDSLCDPMDYTVHGVLLARILEWVAVPISKGSSQPRDQSQVSCIAGRFFTSWATREIPYSPPTPPLHPHLSQTLLLYDTSFTTSENFISPLSIMTTVFIW